MSLLDCAVLLKESKKVKTKLLAEAFVKHAIPQIDPGKLQEAFVQQIKNSLKPELPIFSYKTTEITVDGNTAAEDSLCGQTVASMAYEFCDKLPCGTPIGKAISGWAACELLGMILGPNIHVKTRFKCRNEDHPQWLGYTADIVAQFQEKPLKRSASGLAWWPEAFLKELVTPAVPLSQLERSSESLLNALLELPKKKEAVLAADCVESILEESRRQCGRERAELFLKEREASEGVVWTRDADGIMRCPGGGMNLQDPRTNVLWQTRLPPELVPGPPPLERVGATPGEPVISGVARSVLSIPRGDYGTRPFPPLERVNTCTRDGSCCCSHDSQGNAYLYPCTHLDGSCCCSNNFEVKNYSYPSHSS